MILVLTNYRTGSTNFCKYLAEQNNYTNCDELFHQLRNDQQEENINFLKNNSQTVVKVMPDQILNAKNSNLLELLVELSEKIYVLVRKDLYNQCKSYYVALQLENHWHDNFKSTKEITYNKDHWEHSMLFILDQQKKLIEIVKTLPNFELIHTHQIPDSVKYHRPVKWDVEPIQVDPNLANLSLDTQFEQLNIDINK